MPWPTISIGKLFEIGAGKSVTPTARGGERSHPFLRTSNVFWGRIDVSQISTMHFSDDEIDAKDLRKGDLLVCEGGDIGRSAIWNGELEQCSFQNHLHRLRPRQADTVPLFVMYYLQAGFTQLGIYEGAGNKTTIPNLSRSRLAALEIPAPPKPEQQKIAAVLWKMQRAIAAQDRLIAATRDLKQSAMQQIFTHGLRGEPLKETEIGLMPESWEPTPIRELREFLQYGTSTKCGYVREGRPVIRIPNIVDGRVDTNDIKWAALTEKEVTRYELASGDIIFIRTNGVIDRVGTCSVFRNELPSALFASYLIRARPNGQLHPEFYQYYSMTAQGRAQLSGRASPAADGKFNINTQTIDSVLLPLPSNVSEQRDIAAALATLDRKLAHHQQKRTALNDLFQTTLHQLMTAQIRVADLDIDTLEVTTPQPQGVAA